MQRFNIEIKARVRELDSYRALLQSLGAEYRGTDQQVDTYFQVKHGRLKLREGNLERAMIFYRRPNQPHPKPSDVSLIALTETSQLKALLSAALGIKVVVSKCRAIYFLGNLKIHLDQVDDLGSFLEIEAIGSDAESSATLLAQCQSLMSRLCIQESDLVAESYSDMLLKIRPR